MESPRVFCLLHLPFCLLLVSHYFSVLQVWNANNGHLLNKLEPVEENEVTGIISLPEKSKIITVGWNRKILVYYDDIQVRKYNPLLKK